jgi:hypothetical protein
VQLDEANRLLDLVAEFNPNKEPQVAYWRAVAATHAGDLDRGGELTERHSIRRIMGQTIPNV